MNPVAANQSHQSKSGEDVVLELEYEFEEDIEAELEDFVRLSHTGQFKDAHELFDECLSSHIDWYPVAAEYADCLLREGEFEQLAAFSEEASPKFQDPHENALLELMLMIGYLLPRHIIWRRLRGLWPDLSLKPPYTSLRDTDIHLLEIVLQILVFSKLDTETLVSSKSHPEDLDAILLLDPAPAEPWSVFKDWFYYLLRHEHFWEAQRILHSLFHELPRLECHDLVQDYIKEALSKDIDQDSVRIAVSSLIQRFIYVKESPYSTPLAAIQWNDAISWALFGVTLARTDGEPSSLFSRICLRLSLQEEFEFNNPLPLDGVNETDETSDLLDEAMNAIVHALSAEHNRFTLNELSGWAITYAALRYYRDVLPFINYQFVDARDSYWRTPLHGASLAGQGIAVETLLFEEEADASLLDWFGQTPLHYAARSCVPGSEKEYLRIMKALLLSDSPSVNTKDPSGLTPLHMAVVNQSYDAAELLLQHHAIVETSDYGALLLLHKENMGWISTWKSLLSRYDHQQPATLDKISSGVRPSSTPDLEASIHNDAPLKYPVNIILDTSAALILRNLPSPVASKNNNNCIQGLFRLLENDYSDSAFSAFEPQPGDLTDTAPPARPTRPKAYHLDEDAGEPSQVRHSHAKTSPSTPEPRYLPA